MSGTAQRFDDNRSTSPGNRVAPAGNRFTTPATVPERQSWPQGASGTVRKPAGNRFDGCRQARAVADGREGNPRKMDISFTVLWVATVATVIFGKKEEDKILFSPSYGKWMVATVAGKSWMGSRVRGRQTGHPRSGPTPPKASR
jgi:hypothetical protein